MILLTPGPANTTRTVKEAMCVDDVCHREKVFADVLASIRSDLLILAGVGLINRKPPSGQSPSTSAME